MCLNQVDLLAFKVSRPCCFRLGMISLVVDPRALKVGRQKRAAIVRRAAKGDGRIDGDVAGQILVLSPSP